MSDELQARREATYQRACDQAGAAAWQHPAAILEPEVEAVLLQQLAEVLTPVFAFQAKGRLTGTMDMRTWVMLYCTRPDLVSGESIAKYAARRGVCVGRIQALVKEFREAVPNYRPALAKSEAHVAHMREAHRKRAAEGEGDHPRGKESFAGSSSRPGSARQ